MTMSSSSTIDNNSSESDVDNSNKKHVSKKGHDILNNDRKRSRSRSSSESENHSRNSSQERNSKKTNKKKKSRKHKSINKKRQSLSSSSSESILETKSTNTSNKISIIIDSDSEEESKNEEHGKDLETEKKKNENNVNGENDKKQTTTKPVEIHNDNDVEIINNSGKSPSETYVPTNKRAGRKTDLTSIMIQKDCQIGTKDEVNLKTAENNKESPISYNLDAILNVNIDKLTLAEIENKLTEINDFLKILNKKRSLLLSKKSKKLAHKKQIQRAVENKSSLEFGLFDDCLMITKQGTLRIDKQNKVDNDIQVLDTVDENTKPHSSDDVNTNQNSSKKNLQKDKPKNNQKDKYLKEESTPKPKNDFHELFKNKYSKHKNKRLLPTSESNSDEDDNKNNNNEIISKKRKRILINKCNKKTSKKSFKSVEVIDAISDTDDSIDFVRTRSSKLYEKYQEEFKEFFEPKCSVKILIQDLNEMKNQIINQKKNQAIHKSPKKSIEYSKDVSVNEEILNYIEIHNELDTSDNDFEVLSIPDSNCNILNSSEENAIDQFDLLNLDDKKKDNDDQNTIYDNQGETSDILKILDKKHEVVTEFIK